MGFAKGPVGSQAGLVQSAIGGMFNNGTPPPPPPSPAPVPLTSSQGPPATQQPAASAARVTPVNATGADGASLTNVPVERKQLLGA